MGSGEVTGPAGRAPVMMDVARLAGVSHQTVSRVLSDHPNVRASTRERVLAAIAQLNYQPNLAARTLVTRRSMTVGLLSFESDLFGPASMAYGIEQAARQSGYAVSMAGVRGPDRAELLQAFRRLREQAVDGIIAIVPQDAGAEALAELEGSIPLVGIGLGEVPGVPMVGVDNAAGTKLVIEHLTGLGHRLVHHVAGPADWSEARERAGGWQAALRDAGLPAPEPLRGDWSARSGYEAGRVLAADPEVGAVFCANDQMAVGVLLAMHQAKRRVPEEVSVVGFDDVPEAAYYVPPLTTVRQDFARLGRLGMDLLIERMDGGPARSERITPELVVRESTAPAFR